MPCAQPSRAVPARGARGCASFLSSHVSLLSFPTAHSDPEQSQEMRQDPATPCVGDDFATSGTSSRHDEPTTAPPTDETVADRDPQLEAKEPSSSDSLPWPEAPEERPARPNTLDLSKSLKKLEEVKQTGQRQNSDDAAVKENGVEVSPVAAVVVSEERRALQSELGKCIEDFRKIKIPVAFPNKKRQWQSELLKKYQL